LGYGSSPLRRFRPASPDRLHHPRGATKWVPQAEAVGAEGRRRTMILRCPHRQTGWRRNSEVSRGICAQLSPHYVVLARLSGRSDRTHYLSPV
jgi:hypothetical protein